MSSARLEFSYELACKNYGAKLQEKNRTDAAKFPCQKQHNV